MICEKNIIKHQKQNKREKTTIYARSCKREREKKAVHERENKKVVCCPIMLFKIFITISFSIFTQIENYSRCVFKIQCLNSKLKTDSNIVESCSNPSTKHTLFLVYSFSYLNIKNCYLNSHSKKAKKNWLISYYQTHTRLQMGKCKGYVYSKNTTLQLPFHALFICNIHLFSSSHHIYSFIYYIFNF